MLLQGVGVAHGLVAEQGTERVGVARAVDEHLPVPVARLVAQVPEHRAVGLGEADPELLAVAVGTVVALGQVDGHQPGGVPDGDVLVRAGEQVEGQAARGSPPFAASRPTTGSPRSSSW